MIQIDKIGTLVTFIKLIKLNLWNTYEKVAQCLTCDSKGQDIVIKTFILINGMH